MGIAVRNPVLDDAKVVTIARAVADLSDGLASLCTELREQDDAATVERLQRCRLAVGHLDRAAAELRGDTMRATAPLRPLLLSMVGDPRLPPGRPHP